VGVPNSPGTKVWGVKLVFNFFIAKKLVFNSDLELVVWATKHACRLVESKRQRPREIQINKEGEILYIAR
jgi:hypothetical protein